MRFAGFVLAMTVSLLSTNAVRAVDDPKSSIDAQVAEWWPTAEEKRFDQIGWTPDIRTARKLAAEHDRPVFLFTMDGRVNLGRC